jgi:hypothetical protein
MWHTGQQIICMNDSFSGAVWEWTSSVPRAGGIYTITGMDYLPEWGSDGCVLGFRLREIPTLSPRTYFSAWRFEPRAHPARGTGHRRRQWPSA